MKISGYSYTRNAKPMGNDPHIADTGSRLQLVKMNNCQSKSQTKETVTKTYKPYLRAMELVTGRKELRFRV